MVDSFSCCPVIHSPSATWCKGNGAEAQVFPSIVSGEIGQSGGWGRKIGGYITHPASPPKIAHAFHSSWS